MIKKKVTKATKIKRVVAKGPVQVIVPPGTLPVVAHHPEKNLVEVIPVPKPDKPISSWRDWLFGTEKN